MATVRRSIRSAQFRIAVVCSAIMLLPFSCGNAGSIEQIDYGMSMSAVIDIMGKRGDKRITDETNLQLLSRETWEYPQGRIVFYGNDVVEVWRYDSAGYLEQIIPEPDGSDTDNRRYSEFRYHDPEP